MKELTIEAKVENLDEVLAFVDEFLETLDCPPKAQMQVDVAVEELFVNVAKYAYAPAVGSVTIQLAALEDNSEVSVTLIDRGVPYDPLAKKDPDVTLSAQERQIGGLGIYMVKKSMDSVEYAYQDGQNILTIRKNI
jgi:anti-sigma regulatory factor (Ser/Thr protein kinase)